jgi:hypothetical protein
MFLNHARQKKRRFKLIKTEHFYAVLPVKTRLNAKKLASHKPKVFKRTENAFKRRKTTSVKTHSA